jgi:hypothetical protein
MCVYVRYDSGIGTANEDAASFDVDAARMKKVAFRVLF